jgi:hypothetical protein
MKTFEQKMDAVVESMLGTLNELEWLDDEDFSVSLAAFRLLVSILITEGWEVAEMEDHIQDEWDITQDIQDHYRKSLN